MRYERGTRASHFVCIAFSLLFLPPVPLHSWKRSNAVRRQTLPKLRCRFYQRAKGKFDPRARVWNVVQAAAPFLFSALSLRMKRRRGTKRWSSHCFSDDRAASFSFMFRLRRFISPTYWTIDASRFFPGWEENTFLCLNQSLHTTTIKINQIHMPRTQRHMTYTSKHSGFDGWNFNQV